MAKKTYKKKAPIKSTARSKKLWKLVTIPSKNYGGRSIKKHYIAKGQEATVNRKITNHRKSCDCSIMWQLYKRTALGSGKYGYRLYKKSANYKRM